MTGHRAPDNAALFAAIDANGANLSRWPDRDLANRVREAALADRVLRVYLDNSVRLEAGLLAARDAVDRDIASGGAGERVTRAVAARRSARRRLRWMAAAAAIVIAAGIGGVVNTGIVTASGQQTVDVVVVDPLVFGPLDSGTE
jgi:hypothetical protein